MTGLPELSVLSEMSDSAREQQPLPRSLGINAAIKEHAIAFLGYTYMGSPSTRGAVVFD